MPTVPVTPGNALKCICPQCPTKPDDGSKGLYCGTGASEKLGDIQMIACVCGECPIFEEYRLNSYYFCVQGKADQGLMGAPAGTWKWLKKRARPGK